MRPQSENIVKIYAKPTFDGCQFYTTELNSTTIDGALIAKSVSAFSKFDANSIVRICNIGDKSIEIKANQKVVKMTEALPVQNQKSSSSFQEVIQEVNIGNASPSFSEQIKKLIRKCVDVFAISDDKLKQTDVFKYDIDTGNAL